MKQQSDTALKMLKFRILIIKKLHTKPDCFENQLQKVQFV